MVGIDQVPEMASWLVKGKSKSRGVEISYKYTGPSKIVGKSEDIANAALYLASQESSYITGQTIHVNGGMLMP